MTKALVCVAVGICAATLSAQQAPPAKPAPPQPPASLDIAASLNGQHQNIRKYLAGAADKMPDADFHFKPQGTAAEVRTFGQIVVHLAAANYSYCSRAKGEQAPTLTVTEKETPPKAAIVEALTGALAYCDAVYDGQTATTINEMLKIQRPNATPLERARGIPLIQNIAHNNEHYGNLVTYLRAKGLVPPSSEPR
jgi:uncharacterized damage-inducible protein DinB